MGLPGQPGQETSETLTLPEAVAYARRTRGKRNRPSSGWAGLTPAEQSVVRLAVEGLTNPDIGARLFMSRSTVKTHLSHIYAKLGVTNRTELATMAAPMSSEDRRGLPGHGEHRYRPGLLRELPGSGP
jgi:DNA-binding CsgD family transcriptional regulator